MDFIPYTYLIGWSKLDKWYYGVEYGIKKIPCANPKNLWNTYFTSSKIVEYFRECHGEPDVVSIRKVFSFGTDEEKMINAINWEKRVLSKIDITKNKWINGRIGGDVCPETNKKTAYMRYGVDNVFQSQEIKNKIKKTMIEKYGVEHPSYSPELLEKKKNNSIEKYGVSSYLLLPHIREKSIKSIKSDEVKIKRINTNIEIYGVEHISQSNQVKEKVAEKRKSLSTRPIVTIIREYVRVFKHKIGIGWYQKSDNELELIIQNLQSLYGDFSYEDLLNMEPNKRYISSIKKLQMRPIVMEIKKYKEIYKRKITIGRSWDRKTDQELEFILAELIKKYGPI